VGLGADLSDDDGALVVRKTGDHRGFKPVIVFLPKRGEGISIMANSDRAIIGFLFEIVCQWNASLGGSPLGSACSMLRGTRKVQQLVAGLGAASALVYLAWLARCLRRGRRRFQPRLSRGRRVRIVAYSTLGALWWLFWYADWFFQLFGHPNTYVTVSRVIPWPTAFIWVSWAWSLWMMTLVVAAFMPKVGLAPRPHASQLESKAAE
jgi:hypothetical protein